MIRKRMLCALLCAALLLSVMGAGASAAYDDTILPGARLESSAPVAGTPIPAPTLDEADAASFHIADYRWSRDGAEVAVGDRFTPGIYQLEVTLRLRSLSGFGIDESCYLGGGTWYRECARTVDSSASAVHSVFSVEALPRAEAAVTLPAVTAGGLIGNALRDAAVSFSCGTPAPLAYLVYEDGALVGVGGVNGKGEFVWANPGLTFRAGSRYEITALATVQGGYVAGEDVTVMNPAAADSLTLAADEAGVGYTASYLCRRISVITAAEISGVPAPVDGASPEIGTPVSADPELYSVTPIGWSCEGPFVGGETCEYQLLLTPAADTAGFTAETPVTVNGLPAYFVRQTDEGFVFGVQFPCEKIPTITAVAVTGVTEPRDCALPTLDTLVCDVPELCTATPLGWSCEIPFVGGNTYQCLVLLQAQPGVRGLGPDTPVTINGRPAEFDRENSAGFVFFASFDAPEPPPMTFTDVSESDWFFPGVQYCFRHGLMNGVGPDRFAPEGHCTRAMIVTVLYRMEGSPAVEYDDRFRDVPDGTWYTDAVLWAAQKGIVNGYGDGTFAPGRDITREEFATILFRTYGDGGAYMTDFSPYADVRDISNWARDGVAWAVRCALINGKPVGGRLCLMPRGTATRAECATILLRFCSASG